MKIRITETQLKNIVAESVSMIMNESFGEGFGSADESDEARRREIDAAWDEFEQKRKTFMDKTQKSQSWLEYLDKDLRKHDEVEAAWDEHDGISPRHI